MGRARWFLFHDYTSHLSWQENRTFYPDKFMKFKNPSDYKKPIHLSDIAFCLPTLISQFWKPPPWTSTSCTCYDDKIKDLIHAPTIKNKKKTNNFMEQNITELVSNMTSLYYPLIKNLIKKPIKEFGHTLVWFKLGGKRAPPFLFLARRPFVMGEIMRSVGLLYLSGNLNALGTWRWYGGATSAQIIAWILRFLIHLLIFLCWRYAIQHGGFGLH